MKRYNLKFVFDIKKTTIRIKKSLNLFKKGNLLDVGTTSGNIAEYLEKNGFNVYAIDIVDESIKFARERGIKAYKVDVEKNKIPFKNQFFDTIFTGELIEHLSNPDFFISECNRVLKKDGVLVITIPNLTSLRERVRVLFGNLQMCSCRYTETVGHMRDYNIKEIKALLNNHNFHISLLKTDTVTLPRIGDKKTGRYSIPFLDRLRPTLGDTLIIQANKI